jgi:WD40 repeat protein
MRPIIFGQSHEVATCSGDETVRFWNVDNGGNIRSFGGSRDFLYAPVSLPSQLGKRPMAKALMFPLCVRDERLTHFLVLSARAIWR